MLNVQFQVLKVLKNDSSSRQRISFLKNSAHFQLISNKIGEKSQPVELRMLDTRKILVHKSQRASKGTIKTLVNWNPFVCYI